MRQKIWSNIPDGRGSPSFKQKCLTSKYEDTFKRCHRWTDIMSICGVFIYCAKKNL